MIIIVLLIECKFAYLLNFSLLIHPQEECQAFLISTIFFVKIINYQNKRLNFKDTTVTTVY